MTPLSLHDEIKKIPWISTDCQATAISEAGPETQSALIDAPDFDRLAEVVENWANLSPQIRAAVSAVIRSEIGGGSK